MNVSVHQYCFGRFYLRLRFRATEVYQQLNAQSGRADEAFNFLSPEGFFPFRQVPLSNVASIQRLVFTTNENVDTCLLCKWMWKLKPGNYSKWSTNCGYLALARMIQMRFLKEYWNISLVWWLKYVETARHWPVPVVMNYWEKWIWVHDKVAIGNIHYKFDEINSRWKWVTLPFFNRYLHNRLNSAYARFTSL